MSYVPCQGYPTWRTLSLRALFAATVVLFLLTPRLHAQSPSALDTVPFQSSQTSESDTIYLQANQDFYGDDLSGKDGPMEKIGYDLTLLHAEYQAFLATATSANNSPQNFESDSELFSFTHTALQDYVVIDAIATGDASVLLAELEQLGLQNGETFGAVVSGEMPIISLADVSTLSALRFARPAVTVTDDVTVAGAATSQAVKALGTDEARAQFGLDGTGIKIGVLSDSFDCLGGAAKDMASGDVPANMVVMKEETNCADGKDEGRALVQLIADIAPGAEQTFHTAYGGQAAYANAIVRLAEVAQVDVLVDDIRYLMEPMFQDGIIAQAVDQVVASGIPYFASAGNNGRQAYDSAFESSLGELLDMLPLDLPLASFHDFAPGTAVDPLQRITIPAGTTATFNLQWDQPYASATGGDGSASDLDMILVDAVTKMPVQLALDNNVGRDPIEILRYTNPGPNTSFDLAIVHVSGPKPAHMKYIYTGTDIVIDEYATNSSTIYGHANAQGARAVGAAFYLFTPAFYTSPALVESFSSAGPTPIFFDQNDQPINEVRKKPEIVAPDGVNNTFFGKDIDDQWDGSDHDDLPNFFGTSAAAPNAAAVAVLMLAANPTLTPSQIYNALQSTAFDMEEAGFDNNTGYGLIQAPPALQMAAQHDLVTTQTGVQKAALPGQPIEYVVAYTNQGPNPTVRMVLTNTNSSSLINIVALSNAPLANTSLLNTPNNATDNSLVSHYEATLDNLAVGKSSVVTITGIVDPNLTTDANLINETLITSAGDNQTKNNSSRASIVVRVPRVQFVSEVAGEGADGVAVYTLTLDQVNPYAAVTVQYATSSNKVGTGYAPVVGTATIEPGQSSINISMPRVVGELAVGEAITLQISQPNGSMLGTLTTLTLASNPDSDGDGFADSDDPQPLDPCVPSLLAPSCDQDQDGLTNAEEALLKTDPTKPDSDGDGIKDGVEVKNGSNPLNACDPTAKAAGCGNNGVGGGGEEEPGPGGGEIDTDRDDDGTSDDVDIDPTNPCLPNPNQSACRPPSKPSDTQMQLYLPGIRGKE